MLDVYLVRITRQKLEYDEALLDAILNLLKTDDPEILQDVQFTPDGDIDPANYGIATYEVKFKGEVVGTVRSQVFEDGSFKFEEVT